MSSVLEALLARSKLTIKSELASALELVSSSESLEHLARAILRNKTIAASLAQTNDYRSSLEVDAGFKSRLNPDLLAASTATVAAKCGSNILDSAVLLLSVARINRHVLDRALCLVRAAYRLRFPEGSKVEQRLMLIARTMHDKASAARLRMQIEETPYSRRVVLGTLNAYAMSGYYPYDTDAYYRYRASSIVDDAFSFFFGLQALSNVNQ